METKLIIWGVVQAIFAVVGLVYLVIKFSGKSYTGTVPRTDALTLVEKVKVWGPYFVVFIGLYVVGFHAAASLVTWVPEGFLQTQDDISARHYAQALFAFAFAGGAVYLADDVERLKSLDKVRSAFINRVLKSFEYKRRFKIEGAEFARELEKDLITDLSASDPYTETKGQAFYRQDLLEGVKGRKQ